MSRRQLTRDKPRGTRSLARASTAGSAPGTTTPQIVPDQQYHHDNQVQPRSTLKQSGRKRVQGQKLATPTRESHKVRDRGTPVQQHSVGYGPQSTRQCTTLGHSGSTGKGEVQWYKT
eukprot:3940368-Rhodomonas_salina.1